MTKKDLFERFESHYGRPPVVVDQTALSRAQNALHQSNYRKRHPDYREKHRAYMAAWRAKRAEIERNHNQEVQSV